MKSESNRQVIYDNSACIDRADKKWCVYAHYDKYSSFQEYVFNALGEIHRAGFTICLVSTSESIRPDEISRLKALTSILIIRPNLGYDFGSYKAGIAHLSELGILNCPLLLANDSVYGPFAELRPILKGSREYDLYGITDSIQDGYHLQSYFMLYSKELVNSDAFMQFWSFVSEASEVLDSNSKRQLILDNEIGGSQYFLRHGFKIGAAFAYSDLLRHSLSTYTDYLATATREYGSKLSVFKVYLNPSHSYWNVLLDLGCPFIKRELLLRNPLLINISDWGESIRRKYQYDLELILESVDTSELPSELIYLDYRSSLQSSLDSAISLITTAINPLFRDWALKKNLPLEHSFIFDESFYLESNPDVRDAVRNGSFDCGWQHYRTFGNHERRQFKFS